MPKLTINGREIEVASGTSVLQAAEQLGIEIPHFCYHDRLSVAGNCRMCMVEIEKMPKPVPSCVLPCTDGMVVKTDTPAVQAARRNVMEFQLINHPLDCPICDQAGECDLQDQAIAYGADRGRFAEDKRTVSNKDLGPLIKTEMTRCIQCTRCVRFMEEIAGTPQLGKVMRGEKAEITNLDSRPLTSELSGNIADLCPVGALTNKPYAFRARSWELRKTESIDVLDAVGSNIRIDSRGNEVMRILPRLNEDINEEWISDKTRYACDGLMRQRLDQPYIRQNGHLRPAEWVEALILVSSRMKAIAAEQMAVIAGDLVDCESLFAMKQLMGAIGSPHIDCRQDGATYDVSARAGYIMNTGIAGIEEADALLLIGVNPRHEASLVNARIRKRWKQGGLRVGLVGSPADLTYPYAHLGTSPLVLGDILSGRSNFSQVLSASKKPMVIIGAGALARPDGAALHFMAREIAEKFNMVRLDWNGFNVLQTAASRVGALDLGFIPQAYGFDTNRILQQASSGAMEMVFLLGADEIDMKRLGNAFVVYLGHHGDKGAARADVILPGAAYTEKEGLYVNTEGRPQLAHRAVFAPGEAREDWKVIRAISEIMGKTLSYDTLDQLRAAMLEAVPVLGEIGRVLHSEWRSFGKAGALSADPFTPTITNYYLTDVISRASPTMARCVDDIWPLVAKEASVR